MHTFLIAIVVPNHKALESRVGQRSLHELCRDPEVLNLVINEISKFGNHCGLHKTEIPSKVLLVADEWLPDSGLVTAALKLRRRIFKTSIKWKSINYTQKNRQNRRNFCSINLFVNKMNENKTKNYCLFPQIFDCNHRHYSSVNLVSLLTTTTMSHNSLFRRH